MLKGYPVTRALRWATVALFLAAGLAGLKQVVLPNLSAWQSHIAAILLCALVVFLLNLGLLYRQEIEQNKLSENIIQSLPEIACVIDGWGRFRQWNANFEAALGYTAQEIAEISVLDTIEEDQHET